MKNENACEEIMRTAAVWGTVALLALAGCGKGAADKADTVAPVAQTNPSGNSQGSENSEKTDQISDADKQKLHKYGACAFIEKATVGLINNQPNAGEDLNKSLVSMKAHEATIYTILTLEISGKYGADKKEEAASIADEFMKKNFLPNKPLTGKDLVAMDEQECADFPREEAHRIMENEKDDYDKILENIKNLK
jgi:hypothetical protein